MSLRDELRAFADRIADALEKGSADDWVDQKASPLGKAKHLALAKSGKVPAMKEGKQVLIRRSVLDAWIASRPVEVDASADEEREAVRFATSIGQGRR